VLLYGKVTILLKGLVKMIRQLIEQEHDTEKWFKEMERELNDFFGYEKQEQLLNDLEEMY
jgi:hypothetical protein